MSVIPPGTPSINVDTTSLPHSPLDSEGSPPPPIPPQQFPADDILLSPKLFESSEPHQSERDAPLPRPPKANQEDAAPPPRPPKTHQHTAVSDHTLLRVLVKICSELFPPPHPPTTAMKYNCILPVRHCYVLITV